MGYDSRVYIGWSSSKPDADGLVRVYPDITIELPRFGGWEWARKSRTLIAGEQKYRVMDPTAEVYGFADGYTSDSYDAPLQALDPKALLKYLRTEQKDALDIPSVAALVAALQQIKRRKWRDENMVVVFYGH